MGLLFVYQIQMFQMGAYPMYLRFTVGVQGDREPNFDVASCGNLAQEPVLNACKRLHTILQAPANILLIINCFHSCSKLLKSRAACRRWLWLLASSIPHTCGCLHVNSAAWHGCFTSAG